MEDVMERPPRPDWVQSLERDFTTGSRAALGRAITLIESRRPDHRFWADELLSRLLPKTGHSLRLGVSGIPGAGKSTFIEGVGSDLIERGHQVAVLAIDPSSARSGGSVLGDKTRMQNLAVHPQAFVRPSPSSGTLGGVARRTRECVLLCEAFGFDTVIVETVGVGQSEMAVAKVVDLFLLLAVAGTGDELQGIKRGILEMADLIAVNKADGENASRARQAAAELKGALRILHQNSEPDGVCPEVLTTSSVSSSGRSEVLHRILDISSERKEKGNTKKRRERQRIEWMQDELRDLCWEHLTQHEEYENLLAVARKSVLSNQETPPAAARQIVDKCLGGGSQ